MKTLKNFYIILFVAIAGLSIMAFTQPSASTKIDATQADSTYVIQLRKNTNPKVIQAAKAPLLKKYPEKTLLTQVQPPHYILCIGYFATAAEAEAFKNDKALEKEYAGCTVVAVEKKK